MKIIFKYGSAILMGLFCLAVTGCQKMDRPNMADYPKDASAPGGPLKFYAAFDGTTIDPLRNAVDSVRANFASDNPLLSVEGIRGKAVQGAAKKFIKYAAFNEWSQSSSFTMATWVKRDGATKNNLGAAGPEHIFSLRAVSDPNYHWSNSVMSVFLEGDNAACAVKVISVSPSVAADPNSVPSDNWFTWEGGQTIAGLLDNRWHHIALTYDESTSSMRLYVDGVVNPNVKTWAGHGALRLATSKIVEYRLGRGPRNDDEGDGEGGWLQSSYKGSLDQFRLYSAPLTATEIQTLFANKM